MWRVALRIGSLRARGLRQSGAGGYFRRSLDGTVGACGGECDTAQTIIPVACKDGKGLLREGETTDKRCCGCLHPCGATEGRGETARSQSLTVGHAFTEI
eukprot:scaffold205736_cov32-Tisochrysis_lutea.AAC.4